MATEVVIFAGLGFLAALSIQGVVLYRMHRETLAFLRENMQIGGTPVAVAKEQAQIANEIEKAKLKIAEETRAYRRASISD